MNDTGIRPVRYVSAEVREWLDRLRAALPQDAALADGTRLGKEDLIREIEEFFAYRMSTGPDYSRGVAEEVQQAVRCFSKGLGDQAAEAIRRAHKKLEPPQGTGETASQR
jgi:hypothetical protein